ncbi:MAG: hypothetical protein ABIJ43_02040 [Candidatus Beckwithbacteria bacterium]|nr:hypothetical protein [Patescibacteria group bacterium]
MQKISNSYYIKDQIIGLSHEARSEMVKDLEKIGFKYYASEMGGGGEAKIVEQVIASLNFNNIFFDIFVGVIANRLDRALSLVYHLLKKHKFKSKNKPVVEIFVYSLLRGKNNCYYTRFQANKKYLRNDIAEELRKMVKEHL